MKKMAKAQNSVFVKIMGEISKLAEITAKRMLGYESFSTKGTCFAGVRNLGDATSLVLKLSSRDYSDAIKDGYRFSPFRNTKNWVEFRATSPNDIELLIPWIELSYSNAQNKENVFAINVR